MLEIVSLQNVYKRYSEKDSFVLNDVSLKISQSESVALLGPSGSGKSTLLHIMGLIDLQTRGTIHFENKNTERLSNNAKTLIRLHKIGFVYQYHHLLQEFSAIENVMLPALIAGKNESSAKKKAADLLEMMRLEDKCFMFPSELSGGQRQRVAVARALINDPILLLADEPTGNLDQENAQMVFADILKIIESANMAGVIATHNYDLAKKMQRQCVISDGKLSEK